MAKKLVNGQWEDDSISSVDWSGQLKGYMDQINKRKPFEYSVNADKLYQQYKDQYTSMGKQAMQDTIGQASSLTGGYSNTYAQTAGQQAYDNYLQKLNSEVPQLYAQARASYDADTADLYNRYNLAAQGADRDYAQQRDLLSDQRYQTEWDWKLQQEQYDRSRQEKLDAADQAYRDWQMGRANQEDARDIALMMIQAGKKPSADLLKGAGISDADASTMASYYANQIAMRAAGSGGSSGGSSGGGYRSSGSGAKSGESQGSGAADAAKGSVSNDTAYKEAKTAALLALQSGNVDYAIAGLDDYAEFLTNDQLKEIYGIVEKRFPDWKNTPAKKPASVNNNSAVNKNNAAAQSTYNQLTPYGYDEESNKRFSKMLSKK